MFVELYISDWAVRIGLSAILLWLALILFKRGIGRFK